MTSQPVVGGRTGRPLRRSGPNDGKRFSNTTTSNVSRGTSDVPPGPLGHSGQKSVGRKVRSLRSVAYATHSLRSGSKRSSGIVGQVGGVTVRKQVSAVRERDLFPAQVFPRRVLDRATGASRRGLDVTRSGACSRHCPRRRRRAPRGPRSESLPAPK